MKLIFEYILAMCLFRAAPQDLPTSTFLLRLMLLFYIVSGLLVILTGVTISTASLMVTVNLALLALLSWALLWINNLGHRYYQVLTALAGCSALINLVTLPVLLWAQAASRDQIPGLPLASMLLWSSLFWQIVVMGHIIRHALATLMPIGISLAVLYTFISININRILFLPAPN